MQDANPLPKPDLSSMEEELQNELRSMFELDTQTYLQTYEQVTQQLSAGTWAADIQELYRAIHTIKGGAVTVGADAVLATTTALEEMLSDLRYLQTAPQLEDGTLVALLVEAGEVVSGSLLTVTEDDDAPSMLDSALERLREIHQTVQASFLKEIDEHQQLCQDFANQGFDLMVLDVEMALEQLSAEAQVPASLVDTAAQIFTDLETVGNDLEMGRGWSLLIRPLFELLIESDSCIWRSRSQCYLKLLKDCALEGGDLTAAAKAQLEADGFPTQMDAPSVAVDSEVDGFAIFAEDDASLEEDAETALPDLNFLLEDTDLPDPLVESVNFEHPGDEIPEDLGWTTEDIAVAPERHEAPESFESETGEDYDAFLDGLTPSFSAQELPSVASDVEVSLGEENALDPAKEGQLLNQALEQLQGTPALLSEEAETSFGALAVPEDFLESLETTDASSDVSADEPEWLVEPSAQEAAATPVEGTATSAQAESSPANRKTKIPKIPVPLDRLDRSAQSLVEILLSARSTQGRYQSLQNQVAQIVQLSQDSAAYITQLRQMQDDYALLQNLSQSTDENGLQLEGYRSGYTAINRLLENSLRLSEIGAEAAATAQVTKQEFNKLNVHIKALQSSVEESRLISFKSVAFRLRAVVRDLINRLGKPVNFVIEGESQNLDAGTIQVIEPALLHLLRNAYDHGIESTSDRLKNQKPDVATITLSLKRQGSFYYLSLVDDGGGIDRQKISAIAEAKGLPLRQTETNAQLLQVISQPGFSSQTEVSAVSGRGVGMDVVQHQVQSIDGSLKLMTQLGQGTQFEIKIPVPHLLVPCIVVKAGPQYLAVPTDAIQTMRLWDETCIKNETSDHEILPWMREFEGKTEPMMPILNYWQERHHQSDFDPEKMETAICLRVPCQNGNGDAEAIWLVIDDLVEELDLLITSLPRPLKPPTGMMGMSTLPTGEMIPVLEAGAIAQALCNPGSETLIMPAFGAEDNDTEGLELSQDVNTNLILVVDDAALLRRRLEISLLNYGYEVHCCRDGLEAWNWLQENPRPGLMITDIEMPQMDGLTLVDRCRQSGLSFPILVSSSRLSEEWSKEAQRVGANDYLTKGFSTNELIDRVSGLMSTSINS